MNKFEDSFWRSFLGGVTAATIASVSFAAVGNAIGLGGDSEFVAVSPNGKEATEEGRGTVAKTVFTG